MLCHYRSMLIRPAISHTLTQCWYSQVHLPKARKQRGEGGELFSLCRYCERSIRSHGGKSWTLSDGVDLDELAAHSATRFICVTDVSDGIVIARYVIEGNLDDAALKTQIEAVSKRHGASEPGSGLDIRVWGGAKH